MLAASVSGMLLPTEQQIRELCTKVILAQNLPAFSAAITELRSALREHILEVENRSLHLVLEMQKVTEKIKDGTQG